MTKLLSLELLEKLNNTIPDETFIDTTPLIPADTIQSNLDPNTLQEHITTKKKRSSGYIYVLALLGILWTGMLYETYRSSSVPIHREIAKQNWQILTHDGLITELHENEDRLWSICQWSETPTQEDRILIASIFVHSKALGSSVDHVLSYIFKSFVEGSYWENPKLRDLLNKSHSLWSKYNDYTVLRFLGFYIQLNQTHVSDREAVGTRIAEIVGVPDWYHVFWQIMEQIMEYNRYPKFNDQEKNRLTEDIKNILDAIHRYLKQHRIQNTNFPALQPGS